MTAGDAPNPWVSGEGYENYMGRWSRRLAPLLLRWAAVPPARVRACPKR